MSRPHGHESGGDVELPGLERLPGLVHLLTPEAAGINPAEYEAITPEMVAQAEPSKLRESLIFGVKHRPSDEDRSVVWFDGANERGQRVTTWLALNPEDYNGVARNVAALGRTALNKTLEKYPKNERITDEVQAKARRSAIHTVTGKLAVLGVREAVLSERLDVIKKFQEMAKPRNRNLNRGPAVPGLFKNLMRDIVDDMVIAVANEREYPEASVELMRRTIDKRLYIAGTKTDRANYFAGLLDLAGDYYGYIDALYKTRIYESNKYIQTRQAQ